MRGSGCWSTQALSLCLVDEYSAIVHCVQVVLTLYHQVV